MKKAESKLELKLEQIIKKLLVAFKQTFLDNAFSASLDFKYLPAGLFIRLLLMKRVQTEAMTEHSSESRWI